ncbi:NAD(P)H-hydrate dehydratase [Hominifimenecus sp. rT4P-3]|uniref:NAD(P)H-hydrate dehydratase n=1 Tax=Hominifimenecus sp. rT4P-3 TaxID=3242979 RepID=UPI003DA3C541
MRFLTDGLEMRGMDRYSIETVGIPSIVLMEHAAAAAVEEMRGCLNGQPSILIVCGTGNNGADGLAMARMLATEGREVSVAVIGNQQKATEEWRIQAKICKQLKIPSVHETLTAEYIKSKRIGVVVDGLFGTGLSRLVSGLYQEAMDAINHSGAFVVSIDIPSGISADTGVVLGCAVKADLTVTFQCEKLGMALYPGKEYCGRVVVRDIGIPEVSRLAVAPKAFTMEKEDLDQLPKRPAYSNKGTFGRVLVIAGTKNMAGAAVLSGKAAYRSGTGLVRILTSEENRVILQTALPEAILTTYTEGEFPLALLEEACDWAKAIVIGPGLGISDRTTSLLRYVLQYRKVPVVVDADALNTIALHREMLSNLGPDTILTPHLGEMSRLIGTPVSHMVVDLPEIARSFSEKTGAVLVLKDACTLVAEGRRRLYVNTCGNSGMATGGSGDVLSGIIGGLLAAGMKPFDAASYGVLMHGLAGDAAACEWGERAMMAGDIVRRIDSVPFRNRNGNGGYDEIL